MIETPFNYTGNKFKILNQILPKLDYSKSTFIDLFAGGGSVYTNIIDKYQRVIANDIISDLIGIHKRIIESDDIINNTKSLCPGKNNPIGYDNLRNSYNEFPNSEKLWALMLSCTNNMLRFNQKFKFNQTYGNRGWNPNTDKKVEAFINHIRQYKDKIEFKSETFHNIEIVSNNFMVYADPPYGRIKNENGTINKKQISEAGYNAFWKIDDDIKLYNYLLEINRIGSSFMVSGVLYHNNQTSWMLDKLINDGFKPIEIELDYNKVSRIGDKVSKEIIITNYNI